MALTAGTLRFTLEYGKGLKDRDWIGRQDPYARLQCGAQTMRSRTHIDGGKNPVWNQTFSFNIINENSVEVELWDEDTLSRDDKIGRCTVSLAKVRQMGTDSQQVNVICQKSRKVHGFISVTMTFTPNHAAAAYTPQGSFAPYGVSPPPYQYQPSMPYPATPAQAPYYGAAPSYHPPPAPAPAPYPAYAPPAPAPYAPPAAPAPYPSAPAAYPAPGAPPAPAAGGYYPSMPTQQQFYPGASVPAYTTPPPIHFG